MHYSSKKSYLSAIGLYSSNQPLIKKKFFKQYPGLSVPTSTQPALTYPKSAMETPDNV